MTEQQAAIDQLCDVYRTAPQIAFFLGAGVSHDSGVPLFSKLAQRVFLLALEHQLLSVNPQVLAFVQEHYGQFEPDKLIQFVRDGLTKERDLYWLIKLALYEDTGISGQETQRNTVPIGIYRDNLTLNALITFCAAQAKSPFVRGGGKYWGINRRIEGILTTNFDYLVEGSFNTKYRLKAMQPLSKKALDLPNRLLVYHIHGYLSYVGLLGDLQAVRKSDDVIVSENDYFEAGYDLISHSNVNATSILREHPTVFIGCSMQDWNVRRWLFAAKNQPGPRGKSPQHFAILPAETHAGETKLEDSLLHSLGVETIRLTADRPLGEQVKEILATLYTSLPEVSQADWDHAYAYKG